MGFYLYLEFTKKINSGFNFIFLNYLKIIKPGGWGKR